MVGILKVGRGYLILYARDMFDEIWTVLNFSRYRLMGYGESFSNPLHANAGVYTPFKSILPNELKVKRLHTYTDP